MTTATDQQRHATWHTQPTKLCHATHNTLPQNSLSCISRTPSNPSFGESDPMTRPTVRDAWVQQGQGYNHHTSATNMLILSPTAHFRAVLYVLATHQNPSILETIDFPSITHHGTPH